MREKAPLHAVNPPAWMHVVVESGNIPPIIASWDLGAGESAVLAYSMLNRTCWSILDDREARRRASSIGCMHTGTVGIMMLAKRQNIIPSVRVCLDKLSDAGLWMSAEFVEEILRSAGESGNTD